MADKVTFDDGQLQKLLASIDALEDHAPYWKHFLITAVPIFLASLLGLATALLLDSLKTRRELRKGVSERLALLWQIFLYGFCEEHLTVRTSSWWGACEEVEDRLPDCRHARLRRRFCDSFFSVPLL